MTDTKDNSTDKPKKSVDDVISRLLSNPPAAEEPTADTANRDKTENDAEQK